MAVARNEPFLIRRSGGFPGDFPVGGMDASMQREVEVLQAEKVASLWRLTASLAHEINNPVAFVGSNLRVLGTYIRDLMELVAAYEEMESAFENKGASLGQVAALKRKFDLDFMRQDASVLVEESIAGIQRVSALVHDLLDFSHDGGEWQLADLRLCLDSTLRVFQRLIGKEIELVREYGELPEIYCQPAQLNQVLMDLLLNAADAIEKTGTITARAMRIGDEVRVEIADDGEGIRPELLSRIFDPFFSTKEIGKGLGLSRAHCFVSAHHGRIDVRSEPGKGSCFCLVLPVWIPGEDAPERDRRGVTDKEKGLR